MADTAPAKVTPKKKVSKPKAPAAHPKYSEMIVAAVKALKERNGSSRQAIFKYIMANYKVGTELKHIAARLKTALKAGVKKGTLKQSKGTGAAGSFKLGEKLAAKKPAAKKAAAKKPAKKAVKPKKAAAKKPKASPKKKTAVKKAKPAAKKAAKPKKAAAKSPKKAAKPKAKKPAAKKVAKK